MYAYMAYNAQICWSIMCNSKAIDKWVPCAAGQMNVLAPLKLKDCKVTFDEESNVATLQMSHIDTRMFLAARSLWTYDLLERYVIPNAICLQ